MDVGWAGEAGLGDGAEEAGFSVDETVAAAGGAEGGAVAAAIDALRLNLTREILRSARCMPRYSRAGTVSVGVGEAASWDEVVDEVPKRAWGGGIGPKGVEANVVRRDAAAMLREAAIAFDRPKDTVNRDDRRSM